MVMPYIYAVTMGTGEDANIAMCVLTSFTLPIRVMHEGGPAIDAELIAKIVVSLVVNDGNLSVEKHFCKLIRPASVPSHGTAFIPHV
jgi:hypothetical protein